MNGSSETLRLSNKFAPCGRILRPCDGQKRDFREKELLNQCNLNIAGTSNSETNRQLEGKETVGTALTNVAVSRCKSETDSITKDGEEPA